MASSKEPSRGDAVLTNLYIVIANIKERISRSDQRVEMPKELPVILGGCEHPYKGTRGVQESVDKSGPATMKTAHFNI